MDPLLASALFGYPTSASRFDEAVDEAGVVRPVWRSLVATLARLGGAEVEQRRRQADRLIAAQGASYLYHDDADVERAVAARPRPPRPHGRGLGAAGRGDRAAGPPARRRPRRPLRRSPPAGGRRAAGGRARLELVPVARPDQPAAAAAAPGRLRGRPRAHQRRRVAGAAGPDRRPVGRGLRPPQPHRPGPALPRRAPRPRRPPPQRVLLGAALRARRAGSGGPAGQPHGRPHVRPRPPQLLRALVPGRTARLQPGRGRRPDGPPRSGLAALARRPGAGRRAAPPDRRRRRRPPRARRRQRQGGARAAPRLPPRHRRAGQRAGVGRGGRAGAAAVPRPGLPGPARPAAPPPRPGDAVVRRPRRTGRGGRPLRRDGRARVPSGRRAPHALRRRPGRGRAGRAARPPPGRALTVRGPGEGRLRHHADAAGRRRRARARSSSGCTPSSTAPR